MSETATASDRDVKTGRFLAGNAGNGGRKPGQRNKLGEAFVQDLAACWEKHGIEALERCAAEEPAVFVRVVAGLLPRDVNLNMTAELDVGSFAERFRHALAMLDNAPPRKLRTIEHKAISNARKSA